MAFFYVTLQTKIAEFEIADLYQKERYFNLYVGPN